MRFQIIDAFVTDGPFTGSPAGVCLLDRTDFPDETWMQEVAAEMNLPETAFAHPLSAGREAYWALRWFTPRIEVNQCGHATLATAHALDSDGPVRFLTLSGVISADLDASGQITLDFPTATVTPLAIPDGLADALRVPVVATYSTGALNYLIAEVADDATVLAANPDLLALLTMPHLGFTVTAAASPGAEHDFVSRFFAPASGNNEDPVTGSAHTALAPMWSKRLGRTELLGRQTSRRGGLIHTALHGDRVRLSGRAVTVVDGTLKG